MKKKRKVRDAKIKSQMHALLLDAIVKLEKVSYHKCYRTNTTHTGALCPWGGTQGNRP